MADTRELILRFIGDPRQLRQTMAQIRTELGQFGQGQVAVAQSSARAIQQSEQRRIADTVRSANQRLREEQRAAREVARITAETARQADRQERIREQAAKRLADSQIREARRAARELERSLSGGRRPSTTGSTDLSGLTSVLGQVPALGGLTSQLSSLTAASASAGAATAGLAGPIGLAVAAFAAEVAIVVKVSEGLFSLAKQTADFQGKLFDMSQQVGVSVETLSTLEILAATTGGSIETVAASLAIFQKNLEASHDPTSREAKLLAELGVTASDTEEALAETLQGLFRMGEGSRQTASALQLFGRSGRFVLAILKEADGDLERAKQRFRELGIIVGGDSAKAADQFNDSLTTLQFQMRGLTAVVGNEIIPIITAGLKTVQRIVADNKEGFEALGIAARGLTVLIGGPLVGAVQALGFAWKAHQPFVSGVIGLYERLAAVMQLVTNSVPDIQGNEIPAQDLGGEKSGIALLRQLEPFIKSQIKEDPLAGLRKFFEKTEKSSQAAAEAAGRAAKDIALQQRALEESTRVHREALERERELDIKSIEQWKEAGIDAEVSRLADQQRILEQEKANARQFIKNREDLSLAIAEIDQKDEKAQNDFSLAVNKIRDEAQRRRDQSALDLNQQLSSLADAQRRDEQQKIERDLELGITTLSGAKQRELALLTQAQKERIALIDLELGQLSTSAARKIKLDNDKLESEVNYTREFRRLTQERIDALLREGAAATESPNQGRRVPEGDFVPIDIGVPPPDTINSLTEAFERLGTKLSEITGLTGEFAKGVASEIGDLATSAIEGLAFGIGDLVHQWVLLGTTGPAAMRKFTASVLAGVAAQAAVKAIFQLAEGFAALFFNPAQAAAHFKSAALFASVAAAAGLAGRAIAGNSFQQPSGGGGGGSEGRTDRGQLDPLRLERNTGPREMVIKLTFEHQVKSNDSHIVKTIVKDFQSGGDTREVINKDGVLV